MHNHLYHSYDINMKRTTATASEAIISCFVKAVRYATLIKRYKTADIGIPIRIASGRFLAGFMSSSVAKINQEIGKTFYVSIIESLT